MNPLPSFRRLVGLLAILLVCILSPALTWAHAPKGYVCIRTTSSVQIDGLLNEPVWQETSWSDPFVDIQGEGLPEPRFKTMVAMTWDDNFFYVAARMEEPHIWATYDQRDRVIYHENDFEVFIDPDGDTHNYYELEVNALNTVWDLLLTKPYRDGGHAIDHWNIGGLKTAVQLDGTLNDPSDTDSGWTVEIAFPWDALSEAAGMPTPPQPGDQWRVNFSRVQWRIEPDGKQGYRKQINPETGESFPEDNWVWSPQGKIAMHMPEKWGVVQFADSDQTRLHPLPYAEERDLLWTIYYRQQDHHAKHGDYTDLDQIRYGLPAHSANPTITLCPGGFVASLKVYGGSLTIREDGLIRVVRD